MSKKLKVMVITVAVVVLLGIVTAGVAFAADSNNSSQLPACCTGQSDSACNGYCSASGGTCQPGNCVDNCPGYCNSSSGTGGSCCNGARAESPVRAGNCCGGFR